MTDVVTEDTPLRRVFPARAAAALAKNKGVHTVGDLLEYVPRQYVVPTDLTDLSALVEGQDVFVVARVAAVRERAMRSGRGRLFTAVLSDGHHELDVTFFNRYAAKGLAADRLGSFSGKVSRFNQRWQLTHPEFVLLDDESVEGHVAKRRSHFIPVYSATGTLTSFQIWRHVEDILQRLGPIREPLPATVRRRRGLVGRSEALRLVHERPLDADVRPAMRRLRYDEAFVLQVILAQRRRATDALVTKGRTARPGGLLSAFDGRLPYQLTDGQRAVGETLQAELARSRPMHRLLQGEVGSGKTVVALRAMLAVVDAGGQAAMLAPTEVLAAQHHRSVVGLLGDLAEGGMLGGSELGTKVALLTGSQPPAGRRAALTDAVTGEAGIVIGTHALIQKHVRFRDLALVVVDEQHRFGVEQRDALREKGTNPPHVLVMTATPIPRTVAMTVFGDMETLTLTDLPAGRSPIATHVVDARRPDWVARTWERLAEEVAGGHQAYVVCPKIGDPDEGAALTSDTSDEDAGWAEASPERSEPDGSDASDGSEPHGPDGIPSDDEPPRPLSGVYAVAAQLRAHPSLGALSIEVLHGRLDPDTKDATMQAFGRGEIDVLVATTVIEVGVDVANATMMVVMDADRFGLSQLHQLRGRVGRGSAPGLCLLMTDEASPTARERLDAVAETSDGVELARRDLQLRREGDVLGARQSGRSSSVRFLRMGSREDEELIAAARADATELVGTDPTLAAHPELATRVALRLDDEQAAYLERG
ncbi:MAG: ATP-dependent DNA helicase RecG [Dermatophilaceae bacterium]